MKKYLTTFAVSMMSIALAFCQSPEVNSAVSAYNSMSDYRQAQRASANANARMYTTYAILTISVLVIIIIIAVIRAKKRGKNTIG